MSRFQSTRIAGLAPYTPGEQPKEQTYIKLNTNESPYPPAPSVLAALNREEGERLRLYSDPTASALRQALAETLDVAPENICVTNGSDEALSFAFMAFAEREVAFADITYGFYQVFAALYKLKAKLIPLKADFSIDPKDYMGLDMPCVIANPNAPTGLSLPLSDIEAILQANLKQLLIVDEAYVDFGGTSAVPLTKRYDNLLVVQTFSKSRALAGARLGFAVGNAALIQDLERVRYSTNPYNINRLSLLIGEAALSEKRYYEETCKRIIKTRAWTKDALSRLGFVCLDSAANFLFAKHPAYEGAALYRDLKARGILVRHFDAARIRDYNRITIGSEEEMERLIVVLKELLERQS